MEGVSELYSRRKPEMSSVDCVIRNVQVFLEKTGESQSSFANRIGLKQPTLNRMLSRANEPSLTTVQQIADGMGISISELLTASTNIDEAIHAYTVERDDAKRVDSRVSTMVGRLVEDFFLSSPRGRQRILLLASECAATNI